MSALTSLQTFFPKCFESCRLERFDSAFNDMIVKSQFIILSPVLEDKMMRDNCNSKFESPIDNLGRAKVECGTTQRAADIEVKYGTHSKSDIVTHSKSDIVTLQLWSLHSNHFDSHRMALHFKFIVALYSFYFHSLSGIRTLLVLMPS